ncbi:MAG TPA: pantetheine-phosphate adenylyltransferase [Flavobacteriaceae bacterium]|nr:pantetheine-phosphate adenylyltransferase [Flavobacteriaceae bacterium]MCB9214168.1 pantetheine-phosphate adenylyltransferase [Alteromonas sp.]HPF12554.1 pantetheine-phosphate adenylyltransferase [Flavobacteriaceae bacterium]HQU22456.1 pantetheine-phosphate adenylyltransferase [Flavobacteriaceae bacterium]HQU66423.1 pantetheine-phosphate adenylyltransferase [Flavobacteriaceae bacterium]
MKRAVFPGSFDPITWGHVDILRRGLKLFDEVIIAIGVNAEKQSMWSLADRQGFIQEVFKDEPRIVVKTYDGLTADFCKMEKASFILRGLRNSLDFSYEKSIAQTNKTLSGVESIFIISSPGASHISSTIVRDIARNGGDYSKLVPFKVN